jgi:hypothetical protein
VVNQKNRLTIYFKGLKMPIHNRNILKRSLIVNLRRIAGYVSPLLLTPILFIVANRFVAADDRPSASGDTPYRDVAGEEPVKPDAAKSGRSVLPAGELRGITISKSAKDSQQPAGKSGSELPAKKPAATKETGAKKEVKSSVPAAPKELPKTDDDVIGQPLAPGMIEILQQEIIRSVRERGVADNFGRFQRYTGYKLDSSAAPYTGSELAGNCRLSWYDHMLRNPLGAVAEAERFTRDVHTSIISDRGGLAKLLPTIAEKLDLPKREARKYRKAKNPQEAIEIVEQALVEAKAAHAAALAPLTKAEIRDLAANIYPVMVSNNSAAHTLNDRGTARRLVDLMEKMDRSALVTAAEALLPFSDPLLLEQLKNFPDGNSNENDVIVTGVTGRVVARIETPAGAIIIGGKGPNTYNLDSMGDVALVIDLGGDNTYYDGTVSIHRPLLVNVNLGGHNVFRSSKPAVQAGAVLGVSMIVNTEGGNRYEAEDLAQASTIGGVGIIVEFGGDNIYRAARRVQAQAIAGLGIIIGHGTGNKYHAGMWAQGLGGPLGFGIIDDIGGYDHYYVGGLYVNSYKPETPGYEGFGQGVGGGIRQVADGGIGMLLNGGGHNLYEFDYLSHGGGYWCGLGFARDFGGYSKRLIARKNFYGGERTETLFQRFGCGWGCHYALGFCFDDKGHSTFEGTIMGSGMAWDCSVGALCVFGGNNHFEAAQSLVQGCGAQGSLGILYLYGDDSEFKGWGQGYASSNLTYHNPLDCGGNFSFMVAYGSGNTFGCGAAEHSIVQRGTSGGFLISRPRHDQATPTVNRPTEKTTAGAVR